MLVPPNTNTGMSSGGSSVSSQPGRRHRRLSSLNTVSWPNPNELTTSPVPKPRKMSTVVGSDAGDLDVKIDNLMKSLKCYFWNLSLGG
jgi:hypothetical protein